MKPQTTLVLSLALTPPGSAANCWKTLAPIASGPRQEHGAAAIGHDLYILGGLKQMQATTAVDRYDTRTDRWSTVAPLPLALHHVNVASVGGRLYVLGGMNASEGWPAVGGAWRYEPAADKWTGLAQMPDARGAAAVGVAGSKVFVAGGLWASRKPNDVVSVYDTATDKWTSLPESRLPEGRDHGGGAVIGDTFYVVGGRLGQQNAVRNTTWALDVGKLGKWTNVATMPTARGGVGVAAVDGKIYVFGGEGNPAPNTRGVFPNAESFDAATKTWTVETAMKLPRHGTPATAVGLWTYIAGGGLNQGGGADVATLDAYGPGPC